MKLRTGSESTSTRIESPGKKADAPEADRTKNSRQGKNEIDSCPQTTQGTFFDTWWLSRFGTDHAPAQIQSDQ